MSGNNSITDLYGKRKQMTPTSLIPREATLPLPPREGLDIHPAVKEFAANYSDAVHELDRVRAENDELKQALAIEQRLNEELKRLVDSERALKESYMRYAIAVKTHLKSIVSAATTANNMAVEAAARQEHIDEIEEGIRDVLDTVAPSIPASNGR